jgi:3-dehydroquinate dehydratase-2
MATLLVLHGPNLNLLGHREPDIYGSDSLEVIDKRLQETCDEAGHQLLILQSNAEHELVERIHHAQHEAVDFILFNPAAFTHTSVALRDALLAVAIPFIEVHLSNVQDREDFRRQSYFSDIAVGIVSGFGAASYELALSAALGLLNSEKYRTK